jgi:parvulin-like peptidyl-prolyl isomerase
MITRLRKQLDGRFFKGFILLICLLMTGVLSLPFLLKQDTVPWVFSINGIKVTQKQFDNVARDQQERLMQFKAQYGQLSDYLLKSMNMSTDPRELAKQQLEQETLLDSFAQEIGLYPRNKNSLSLIEDYRYHSFVKNFIPEYVFNEDGTLNQYGMRTYLQRQQLSVEGFYELCAKNLVRYLINGLVEITGYVPNSFVNTMVNTYSGSKSYSYLEFELSEYVKKAQKENPSEQTLVTFFQEEQEQYRIPEKRTIAQWVFDPSAYNVSVSLEQMVEYYEKYKNAKFVKNQSKTTIRQIIYKGTPIGKPSIADLKDQIAQNPELFTEKARLYSDDSGSAQNGGLLKPFTKGTLNPIIEKAAFSIEKEGDVSDVIPLSDGFALIQLVERAPRTFFSLEEVKNEVKAALMNSVFTEQLKQDFSEITNINRDTVESFAKKHNGTRLVEVKTVNKQDQIALKAFALEVGQGDSLISQDKGYLFILESIQESFIPSLETIKERVIKDWQEQQALVALNTDVNDLRNLLKKGGSLGDTAAALNYSLKKTGFLTRTDEKKLKKLEKDGFPVSKMIELGVPGTIALGFDGKRAVLIQLDQIVLGENNDPKESKAIVASFQEQNRRQVVRGLIASLNKTAKIEYNQMTQASLEDYSF